jgi:hypothetical protein
MGTYSSTGGPYRTAWFTETDPAAGVERMKAVVVRRVVVARTGDGSALLGIVRALWRHKLDRRVNERPRMLPPEWSASVGPNQEVLYSRERALVRVHGVEYAIPNDECHGSNT